MADDCGIENCGGVHYEATAVLDAGMNGVIYLRGKRYLIPRPVLDAWPIWTDVKLIPKEEVKEEAKVEAPEPPPDPAS